MSGAIGHDAPDRLILKQREIDPAEKVGEIADNERIAEIGLVAAVFKHCVGIGYALKRSGCDLLIRECCKGVADNLFTDLEDVLLSCKRHFKVKLIEFAGRSVLPCVLVAEAGSYLIVLFKAGDHEKLFELLRSLRKSVKLALVLSAGYEKISCAFRRGGGENGGLDIKEAAFLHERPKVANYPGAQNDIGMNRRVSQVEIAVFKAHILSCSGRFVDIEGEHVVACAQNRQLIYHKLDRACRQLFIDGFGITL